MMIPLKEILKCEDEEIHIPQLIQPIGYFLAIELDSSIVLAVCENIEELFLERYRFGTILEHTLDLFLPELKDIIEDYVKTSGVDKRKFYKNFTASGLAYPFMNLFVSSIEGTKIMIELIPQQDSLINCNDDGERYQNGVERVTSCSSLEILYQKITDTILELTQYDRVMVYKFDSNFNGEVLAESKIANIESLLNLHYPAADIPVQARELYLKNRLRIISDVSYKPLKIVSFQKTNIDMTYSFLRSVSPYHLEYMKNMGVYASMSISIVVNGKLWGLIACHHHKPYYPPLGIITMCEKISKIANSQIELLEEKEKESDKSKFIGHIDSVMFLLKQKVTSKNIDALIGDNLIFIKSLFQSDGFLYISEKNISSTDINLTMGQLKSFSEYIKGLEIQESFITNELFNTELSLEGEIVQACAGVVIVKVPNNPNGFFVWTKIEQTQTINWGGNPKKEIGNTTISPRISFEKFSQTVIDKSLPWDSNIEEKVEIFINRFEDLLTVASATNKIEEQNTIINTLEEEKSKNQSQLIDMLVGMIEERDAYTAGHTNRVAKFSVQIAKKMGLNNHDIDLLEQAAKLHDIGKIAIPDSVLLKPGKLSKNEYNLIQQHLTLGYAILSKIDYYKPVAEIMRYHHEKFDGTGYPYNLQGEEIPLLSHIMIVADSLDAMTSNRIYQKRKTLQSSVDEILSLSGTFYHPLVVEAVVAIYDEIKVSVEEANQLPLTNMEHERFSYFFKDQMTGFFNEAYLSLVLHNEIPNINFDNVAIIELHGMSQYNKLHSWHSGNLLISKFAQHISNIYGTQLISRVFGDDFAILFLDDAVMIEEKINLWEDIQMENVYTTFRKVGKEMLIEELQLE